MLKKLKIKQMIIFSIGILLISIIVMGVYSIVSARSIAGQTAILYNKPHTNLMAMKGLESNVFKIGSLVRNGIITDIDQTTEINGNIAAFDAQASAILTNMVANTSTLEMENLVSSFEVLKGKISEINSNIQNGDYNTAKSLIDAGYNAAEKTVVDNIDILIGLATKNAVIFKDNAAATAGDVFAILLVLLGISIALAIFALIIILRNIANPIKEITRVIEKFSEGNLNQTIDYNYDNEFGFIAQSINNVLKMVSTYIGNISDVMGHIADKDLTVTVGIDYIGDFNSVKTSMLKIVDSLRETVTNIQLTADQVSSGSQQVSLGALALAEGSTEQANSVEELAARLEQITEQINHNAKNSKKANQMASDATVAIGESNVHMQNLMSAMNDINQRSGEIGKIIKTIEDIAFQTNILALNAAVEAARAGTAGKGFAVVADEVRNLASKSAEAAKNTTALIEASIQSIDSGVLLAEQTATGLAHVVEGAKATTLLTTEISHATGDQADALDEISNGVDNISKVVQTNSATSEESAAAAEELSRQSSQMKDLISSFRLH